MVEAAETGMRLFAMSCCAADSRSALAPATRPMEAMTVELRVLTQADPRRKARQGVLDYLVEQLRGMRNLSQGCQAPEDPRVHFGSDLQPLNRD